MGITYRHLQPKDRIKIYQLLFNGYPISDIAREIGYHRSTLYRELSRNSSAYGYRPDLAAQQYITRRQTSRPSKLAANLALRNFIIQKLKEGWSPDLISGRLSASAKKSIISRETIYRYIYSPEGLKQKLYQFLMKKRRFRYPRIKRRRKTIIKSKKPSIHERSEIINKRKTFGHWEGDLILFRHTKTNLFTLRERKSRLMVALKNPSRQAEVTTFTLIAYMEKNIHKTMRSLTLDNDQAFAYHKKITKALGTKIYFCNPYKSYQKGAIENANKLLRTHLPNKIAIDNISQSEIDQITNRYNHRPMKCLGYQTPHEVFTKAFNKSPL